MSDDFKKLITKDRETRKKSAWSGTMLDYLELVRKNPDIADLAHRRMHNMIMSHGAKEFDLEENPRLKRIFKGENYKTFNFFADDFYGMEKTVNQIVRYFHSASLKGEESRQVLYLVGPVGSGKSSLVDKLKQGLEAAGPIHAIDGCPMFEEPLHFIVPRPN